MKLLLHVYGFSSIRAMLAVAIQQGMIIHQMDVVTAFLNGSLEEEIYMIQPKGYVIPGKEHLVCKLNKSLYGLKQAPRCWNRTFTEYMKDIGFKQSNADSCVYIKSKETLSIVACYVDDLVVITETEEEMASLKGTLACRFKMKDMGELQYCLGVTIDQDKETKSITIHQEQYIQKILGRYGLLEAKTVSTPADVSVILQKDDGVSKLVDSTMYQSMVGSLLYIAMCTRPDIAQAVGVVSKFNSKPMEAHLTAVKRILRYLKGTSKLGLKYEKGNNEQLIGYSDADWAGDRDDRHSTSGYVSLLSGGAITWMSKKQASVALSTAEAEYIALSSAAQEVVWLCRLLSDFGMEMSTCTQIMEDNQGSIAISRNPVLHSRSKHIDIRYHYIREAIDHGIVDLTYCPTKEMVADILTKAVSRGQFEYLRIKMGLQLVN